MRRCVSALRYPVPYVRTLTPLGARPRRVAVVPRHVWSANILGADSTRLDSPRLTYTQSATQRIRKMPPRSRHRRPTPGTNKPAGGNEITGKRNTQAKNQRYARPLPVRVQPPATAKGKSSQSWWQGVQSWVAYMVGSTSIIQEEEPMLVAYWDATTCSAWVQVSVNEDGDDGDSAAAAAGPSWQSHSRTAQQLWTSGFFGKGSLSRSEPTWKMRKVNEEKVKRQRERGMKGACRVWERVVR